MLNNPIFLILKLYTFFNNDNLNDNDNLKCFDKGRCITETCIFKHQFNLHPNYCKSFEQRITNFEFLIIKIQPELKQNKTDITT